MDSDAAWEGRIRARPGGDDPLATSQGADRLGDVGAPTDGYSTAFLGAAGIAVVGALLAAALLRAPKATAAAPSETQVEARERIAA